MVDAVQVQIRRDTASNLAIVTPAEGEIGYDQTNKRLIAGDGSTLGGTPHVNYIDMRTNAFIRGTIGGTANAITLTLSPSISSYSTNLELQIRPVSPNTGPVTINVDGVGDRNIYKLSSGSLVSLETGDLINGIYYRIVYDGVQFQLSGSGGVSAASVSQGDLNTSIGSFSSNVSGSAVFQVGTRVALPGGQYGFWLESTRVGSAADTPCGWVSNAFPSTASYSSYASVWGTAAASGVTLTGRQRYITSSPPYDMGDGDVGGFIFALVDKNGDIVSSYMADTPPWAYNGPTDIRCTHKCPLTGKKYRKVMKKSSFKALIDGEPIKYQLEEITHEVKNADMDLIPHPFDGFDDHSHTVVMLDPMSDKVSRMIEYQNNGSDDPIKMLVGGYVKIDNDTITRSCHKSVKPVKFKFKST